MQYVAVTVGWGGILGQTYGLDLGSGLQPPPSRVLAFKVGAGHELPPLKPARKRPKPPPRVTDDMSILSQGAAIYAEYCQRCHGQFAVSNGRIPDLRRSAEAVYSAFNVIVLDGGLEQLGMPAFKDVLSSDDALSLKAYLIDAANDDWEQRPVSAQ